MKDFLKYWTIINTVWQIVNNFIIAGGPTVNPILVANETAKELKRKVESGHLPKDVLVDHEQVIKDALRYHPLIQNPKEEDSVAAVLDKKAV